MTYEAPPCPHWTHDEWKALQVEADALMREARSFLHAVNAGGAVATPDRAARLVEELRRSAMWLDHLSIVATVRAADVEGGA